MQLLDEEEESDSQRFNKRRRSSCADINLTPYPKDPDSPIGCSKQKRHRRTAAEIDRGFKCTASNCHKAYGTEGALKMHLRIKHPSHHYNNAPTSNIHARSVHINTSALHQLAVPTNSPSMYPMDSPGFDIHNN